MPSDSKRKHAATTAAADEIEVRVDVEAIVDGAEQKKGGGSSTLFVSNLPYTGSSALALSQPIGSRTRPREQAVRDSALEGR